MSYSKVENKKIRKRNKNSENFTFEKSQDLVNSDNSRTVNPLKLLGWANETLHKLKVDKNHLQKTKKKKANDTDLSSRKSKSKNTTVEPSSPIKESTLTYISEVVTQSKKKRRKIKCVEVGNSVSETENLLHASKNMTHKSKDSYDKTNNPMGLKQRFGKISWSDGREDLIYEHEVIPKKKKRKKCERGEVIILNANVCVPEKNKKKKKDNEHRSVRVSKDIGSAFERAKFENGHDLILFNDSESVLEKKKKEKELVSLGISEGSRTHVWDKCEKSEELILLNDSESVPGKKRKKKGKEFKSSEDTLEVGHSINDKSTSDIKRKYQEFNDHTHRSIDSESNLKKRKKYKLYENKEGIINESSAIKKKEKAIQVSDIESVSKKDRKKKRKENYAYNETDESLEKPKKNKHKKVNILNDRSEKSTDIGKNKNKLYKDGTSYELDSFEYKRKQKVKCQDELDENSYVNKSKRHDNDSGEIFTEQHKDEGECSPEHRKRKGRHLDCNNVDLIETCEYTPKKKRKSINVNEEIDINISIHGKERVNKKKKKKKEKDSDSVVSQESRGKHKKLEDSEASCVANDYIQSAKRKHKKKHNDASETDIVDAFKQKKMLEDSTVLVEEKNKYEEKSDRNDDDDDDVEYQSTFVTPILKVRKKSAKQSCKFGPSPIFRLLMADSDDGERSCKTCHKYCNTCSNRNASVSKKSDNVVNMYDFSSIMVKTEPGIVIKKEIIEESAPDVGEIETSLATEVATNCTNVTSNANGTELSINIDISNVTVKEEPLSPFHDSLPNRHSFESSATQTEMIDRNEVDTRESREGCSTYITSGNEHNYETQLETSYNIYDDKLTIKDEIINFSDVNIFENVDHSRIGDAGITNSLLESSDMAQTQITSVVNPDLDNAVSMDSNKQTNTEAVDVESCEHFSSVDEFISINIPNSEVYAEGEHGNELLKQRGSRYFPPLNVGFPDNRPLQQRIPEKIYILHFTQVPKKLSKASLSKLLKVPIGNIRVNPNYYDYRWCQNYITVKFDNEYCLQNALKYSAWKVKCSNWFVNTIPVRRER